MTERLEVYHIQTKDGTATLNGHLLKLKVTLTQELLNTAQISTKDGLLTMVKPEAFHTQIRDGIVIQNGL